MCRAVPTRLLSLGVIVFTMLAVVLATALAAPETLAQGPAIDYDSDDNNLIEVGSLEQLNAVRWDLDGNGASDNDGYTAAFPDALPGMGCDPTDGCAGYELTADLDFDTDNDGSTFTYDADGNAVPDAGDDYYKTAAKAGCPLATTAIVSPPAFTATATPFPACSSTALATKSGCSASWAAAAQSAG